MWGKPVVIGSAIAAALCLGLTLHPAAANADDYPSHPITMIIPLAPGGSTDVLGRIMAQAMRPTLDQPVVVENTAGAAAR